MSQEELARRAGMSLKGMGDIERGDIEDPHYSSLSKIAHALGTSVAMLVGEEPGSTFDDVLEEERRDEAASTPDLEEALKRAGAETAFLALEHEELEKLYEDAATFEEAHELTRKIVTERGLLNKFVGPRFAAGEPSTIISGEWIVTTQANIWTALAGIEKAAKREAEAARRLGDEAQAAAVLKAAEAFAKVA